jgi:hypothetical protein
MLALSGAFWIGLGIGVAMFGVGMATVMWVSAAHVLFHADRIADQACAEEWAA